MAQPKREAMTNVDKAWLDMDSATNLMIINGVMLFDGVIDFARAVTVLNDRLVSRFSRFHQRVVNTMGPGMAWEDDPYFDLRHHVRHLALPAPGDVATLQRLVSEMMSEGFEPNRPLWRFYIIENVEGGSAVFGRLHHSIADGVALVQVLLSLTDATADGPRELPPSPFAATQRKRAPGLLGSMRKLAAKGARLALDGASLVYDEAAATLQQPSRITDGLYQVGLASLTSAAIVGKLLLIPPDNDSVFKGELSAHKRVVWSEPVQLAAVKEIGRAAGATVNDVLVAAVAGALRTYMLQHGGAVDIRTMIPVNLRDLRKPITQLGNQFALVYLTLPLEAERPEARLKSVKAQMDVLKQSPEPLIVYEILTIVGMAPGEIADYATTWFSGKASVVLTNVPGPREPIYFAGLPLKRILFWVPQSGRIGLGVSIISYNGEVTLGVMVDEGLVDHPEHILASFHNELATIQAAVTAREGDGTQVAPPAAVPPVAENGAAGAGVAAERTDPAAPAFPPTLAE